jgi:hypothetical protein
LQARRYLIATAIGAMLGAGAAALAADRTARPVPRAIAPRNAP